MRALQRLLDIMQTLRDPEKGCPWDLRQDFWSIAPHTIEEAYEVADAIERQNYAELKEELGDLLLQVVYHAQMAKERDLFNFEDVAQAIADKLVRRHPHVFADLDYENEVQLKHMWEQEKAKERRDKATHKTAQGLLNGITSGLPALTRAQKLQNRAATVGFDWQDSKQVFAKVEEEMREVLEAYVAREPSERIVDEIGDLLFVVINLARHLKVDAEQALRSANRKFEERFSVIESIAAEHGQQLQDYSLEELDALWERAKRLESSKP